MLSWRVATLRDALRLSAAGHVTIEIRSAVESDRPAIWQILEPVVRAGETYALPRDAAAETVLDFWCAPKHQTFLAFFSGKPAGTYYLKANQQGGGAHVANCGYVTAGGFSRRGLAEAMFRDSVDQARRQGFTAMQFNFVVASNEGAVRLWTRLGFDTVGRLPRAFAHPRLGLVDALVMYREL